MSNIADRATRRKRRRKPSGGIRRNIISGQFAPLLTEMLRSPAFRVLSLAARRVIDRVQVELGYHAGHDSARLPVSFADFEEHGIHRHRIAAGIREAVALGFLKVTRAGRAGNADFRRIAHYQLTFAETVVDGEVATHDWRKFKTMAEAEAAAKLARAPVVSKNRKPVAESAPEVGAESAPKTQKFSVQKVHYVRGKKCTTFYISDGAGGREAALGGDDGRHGHGQSVIKPKGSQQTNSPVGTSQTNNPIGISQNKPVGLSQTHSPIEPNRRLRPHGVR
jgi:hypothetical protein